VKFFLAPPSGEVWWMQRAGSGRQLATWPKKSMFGFAKGGA